MSIANTTTDLNQIFRTDMRDPLKGDDEGEVVDSECLWSEADIYRYMTVAIDMVSKLTGGRYKIYQLPVTIGINVIHLPKSILNIRSARLLTAGVTLTEANANEFLFRERDDYGRGIIGSGGPFGVTGSPANHYIRDYDSGAIRLVPTPNVADTLELQVDITSPVLFDAGFALPFVDTEDQMLVLAYMKYLAFSTKHDADAEELKRGDMYLATFTTGCIERESRLRNYRRAPGRVSMDW